MAVLKDDGHTVCDAGLELRIKNHESKIETILLTADGTIKYSGKCRSNNVTDVPDYFAYYQVEEPGTYEMKLTNLDNGYEILDSFEVRDSVPFEIERIGPTRIYPPASYEMTLKIKANQDFSGEVIETLPSSFVINDQFSIFNFQSISNDSMSKQLIWQVELKKGENYELKYQFDAPDISPYIYLLGPLQIGDPSAGSGQSFKEIRQWQIASDAVANMILLWDDAVLDAPTGWTCISCTAGQDLYQKFIRGNTSYAAGTGATTHTHTNPGTLTSGTGTAVGTISTTNIKPPLAAHTHTSTITSGLSGTNIPAYRYLKVIRYNNGIPSTLPAGVIAIFDATQPSGWTAVYNDSKYIYGYNTANVGGTGGSNTHTHTIVLAATSAATNGTTKVATSGVNIGGVSHTHPSSSNTTPNQDHQPPYMTVILAKKDSAGSIPANMIAMFDNAPPTANWTLKSNTSGDPFYQRFFSPTGVYGTSSDVSTHTHSNLIVTTTGPSGTTIAASGGTTYTTNTHTHSFTVSFGSGVSHLPPYWDAIFAKAGATTPTPNLEQIHYHWRNDDNNEQLASSATSGSEDTTYDTFFYTDNKRIRIEISNEGGAAAENMEFRLEYGLKETTCLAISSWTDVGAIGGDWDMYNTANLTDGNNTNDIATSTGGVSNANPTFKTSNLAVKDEYSQVATTTLSYEDFMEMEFSIKPSTSSGTYCFRITNAGSITNFTYTRYPETTIFSNTAPTVGSVTLTDSDGENIDLNEGTTKQVWVTALVTDAQGCSTISSVIGKIFHNASENPDLCLAQDDNNCYYNISCSINASVNDCTGEGDNDAQYKCMIDMQFHADPTDTDSPWDGEHWDSWMKATDSGSLSGTNQTTGIVEVITLRALNITATINYPTLTPGQNTESTNQETTVTNTGNSAIDVKLSGTDMTWSSNTIDTSYQKYSLSPFDYNSGGITLKEGPGSYDNVNAVLPKPTESPSNSSDIFYWGLGVPSPMPAGGPYQGTNTFEAINAL